MSCPEDDRRKVLDALVAAQDANDSLIERLKDNIDCYRLYLATAESDLREREELSARMEAAIQAINSPLPPPAGDQPRAFLLEKQGVPAGTKLS